PLIGEDLDSAPAGGKTMVLPYSKVDHQSAFVWQSGIQPNSDCLLEDWAPNRTLVCHSTGNQYANRVGETVVGGVLSRDPRVLALARLWGIDRWLVHEDWSIQYLP